MEKTLKFDEQNIGLKDHQPEEYKQPKRKDIIEREMKKFPEHMTVNMVS